MKQTGFRNLGFVWGVRSGPKGTVIDLPIFGFEGHNPYPVRANTMKQIGSRNLGFALGVLGRRALSLIKRPMLREQE